MSGLVSRAIGTWQPGVYANISADYSSRAQPCDNGSLGLTDLQLQDAGFYLLTVTDAAGSSRDAALVLQVNGTEAGLASVSRLFVFQLYASKTEVLHVFGGSPQNTPAATAQPTRLCPSPCLCPSPANLSRANTACRRPRGQSRGSGGGVLPWVKRCPVAHRGAVRGPPVPVRLWRGTGRHRGAAHAQHVAAGQAVQEDGGAAAQETDAR